MARFDNLTVVAVLREVSAWDLGADDWEAQGEDVFVRVRGGRSFWESCWCGANNRTVRLGRINSDSRGLWRQYRYVHPDTRLEVVRVTANPRAVDMTTGAALSQEVGRART